MKTLGKILLTCAAITTGSLFLPGCSPKKGVSQKIQDLTEAVVEDIYGEGSYQEALDIANNPNKYFSGNVVKEEPKIEPKPIEEPKPKEVVKEFSRPPKNLEDYFFQGEELKEIILVPERYAKEEAGSSFMVHEDNPYIVRDIELVHKVSRKNCSEVGEAYYWILSNNKYVLPESAEELVGDVRAKRIKISQIYIAVFKFDSEESARNFLEKQRQERRGSGIELQKKDFWISVMLGELTTADQAISYVNSLEAYVKRTSPETISIINNKSGEDICQEEFFSRILKLRNFLESSRRSLSEETIRRYVYELPAHSLNQ